MQIKSPVVFIIFNRPTASRRVFEEIRKVKPSTLYIIADGPRESKPGEAQKCREARELIESVDWDCNVIKNFSDKNLGCKRRLSSGIDWVFGQTDRAIFLEDDCLPSGSFFRFSDELLEKYKDEEKITNISGINLQFGKNSNGLSYYFSQFVHVWGWASWKRVWKNYDIDMRSWPGVRDNGLFDKYFANGRAKDFWYREFQNTYDGKIDTWDYQWVFSCWLNNGLTIIPDLNLVSNIGFTSEGVHTGDLLSEWANIPANEMEFPLKHPEKIERNKSADELTQNTHYSPGYLYRIKRKLKKVILKRPF